MMPLLIERKVRTICPQVVAVRVETRIDADHGCHEGAHAHEIFQIRVGRLKNNAVGCC